ncbi:cytochrome c oxidase subunit 2A [Cohnella cholangitidis]|uniref:Cytochrome c oxidase subunit 2A n=1 Tax=Cohnella cholangitidis TaxID=2598458 RepID=A0A7G5BYW9_9BACL|nr:cytochrome c oxidase subunit 2A [Cohnella cholangitidis]QMV42153.1 cytochrome c oxidase subunit 2A [Cohnella cholangitidis]
MESVKPNRDDDRNRSEAHSQKGTLLSVFMVGAFIALLFVAVFGLYMSRV